jgi:hypothetical protein
VIEVDGHRYAVGKLNLGALDSAQMAEVVRGTIAQTEV